MSMALFSPTPSLSTIFSSSKPKLSYKPHLTLLPFKKPLSLFLTKSSADNGAGASSSSSTSAAAAVVEEKLEKKAEQVAPSVRKEEEVAVELNGAALKTKVAAFKDPRWVKGTWDLKQFGEDGKTDWDAVIDAEARRRKWLEDNPEASSNDEPVLFDTSVIPWWSWIKRYHLPEAELLNGRAAMVGFFMAYFVDSLTGVGLVDQMGNFFCKTLLFVAVVGVLLIRKNEDIETVKKLFEETTFYDKQWQATWQEDSSNDSKSK